MRTGCQGSYGALGNCVEPITAGSTSISGGSIARVEVTSTHPQLQCVYHTVASSPVYATSTQIEELRTAIQQFPLTGALEHFSAEVKVISNWTDNALLTVTATPSLSGELRCAFQVLADLSGVRLLQDDDSVEEKFGEQNFRVCSEMRGKKLYIDPSKSKFLIKI